MSVVAAADECAGSHVVGCDGTSPRGRTQYFSLDEGGSNKHTSGGPNKDCWITSAEKAWAQERRELEVSKVKFNLAVKEQNLVEQSVTTLLRRLEKLPCQAATRNGEAEAAAGSPLTADRCRLTPVRSSTGGTLTPESCRSNTKVAPEGLGGRARPAEELDLASLFSDSTVPEPALKMDGCRCDARDVAHETGSESEVRCKHEHSCNLLQRASGTRVLQVDTTLSPKLEGGTTTDWIPGANWSPKILCRPQRSKASSPEWTSRNDPFMSAAVGQGALTPCTPRQEASSGAIWRTADHLGLPNDFHTPPCSCPCTPRQEPRSPIGGSPADLSLVPAAQIAAEDAWHGWIAQATRDGYVFYHHAASNTSQWQMPPELSSVFGEWKSYRDQSGTMYWYNDMLKSSSWSDPRQSISVWMAAIEGNEFFLNLYLHSGGDLNVHDVDGRTALHMSCAHGMDKVTAVLLQGNASVNALDSTGGTPLHLACRHGHGSAVRMLLEWNSNPNCSNALGETPLHEAAYAGIVDSLHWLVLARANPHDRNCDRRTPAEVAALRGAVDAAILLQRHERHPCWMGLESCETAAKHVDELQAALPRKDGNFPGKALVLVRAARPLLRGVQWLAGRLLGEQQAHDSPGGGVWHFDDHKGRWELIPKEEYIAPPILYSGAGLPLPSHSPRSPSRRNRAHRVHLH